MNFKFAISGYGRMGKIRAEQIEKNPLTKLTHVHDVMITKEAPNYQRS